MAEPGLLALRRPDERDDLFRAQWGGSERALAAAFATPEILAAADWQCDRRGVPREEWLADLDYLRTAAVYIRDERTRVYLPLWFGLPTAGLTAGPGCGALVRVESLVDARELRRRWRALKGAVADAIEAGALPVAAAAPALRGALSDRETGTPRSGESAGFCDGPRYWGS